MPLVASAPAAAVSPGASAGTSAVPAATPVASPVDFTKVPYVAELQNVQPDGSRSLDSALRLFAITFGPLPGVTAPTDQTGVRSGNVAIAAVLAHQSELTPEQNAAVQAYLAPPPDAVDIDIGPVPAATLHGGTAVAEAALAETGRSGAAPSRGILAAAKPTAEQQQLIEHIGELTRASIAAKLGFDIPGPIKLSIGGTDKDGDFGFALPLSGATYTGCKVSLLEPAVNGEANSLTNTMAHEMFHCFEFDMIHPPGDFPKYADWLMEGAAEWVGADLAGANSTDTGWWEDYLSTPSETLFQHTYDAIGFFSHLEEVGIDPWVNFPAMFAVPGNPPDFKASGADSAAFLESWGSSYFRQPGYGRAWDAEGPGIPSGSGLGDNLKTIEVGNGTSAPFAAGAYSSSAYVVNSSADVTAFTLQGYARLADGAVDSTDLDGAEFCTKDGGCDTCPDGEPIPEALPGLGSPAVLGVSGGPAATSGLVSGMSLDDACKKNKAVRVHVDRPAMPGVLAGTVLDWTSCDGPWGTWKGVLRAGGLDDGQGFTVPFQDLPVQFTVGGTGTQHLDTSTGGTVQTPLGPVDLSYVLHVTVNAKSMTIVPDPNFYGEQFTDVPIEPAPAGSCP